MPSIPILINAKGREIAQNNAVKYNAVKYNAVAYLIQAQGSGGLQ